MNAAPEENTNERPSRPSRAGLNASEAAIAWAYARFGGDVEACSVLDGDAARALQRVVEPVLEADDAERVRLSESWRREDRRWDSLEAIPNRLEPEAVKAYAKSLSPRWQEALGRIVGVIQPEMGNRRRPRGPYPWHESSVRTRRAIVWLVLRELRSEEVVVRDDLRAPTGFDLEQLVEMAAEERESWIRQLGVSQLAELARDQDRRSLVRLRRALRPNDREWFDVCMAHKRDVDRLQRGRLRELFLAISRQEPDLTVRLLHLGLYSTAAAAGARFAAKLESVAARLPSTFEALLLHYHKLDRRDAPASLAVAVRRSLDTYTQRHQAWCAGGRHAARQED